MRILKIIGVLSVCALNATAFIGPAGATTITFATGDYDNTENTVTGTNAVPIYNNNQTTGLFRDVFWWGTAYNGGTKGVGSPDFINAGMNVISNGGSPARARPLGNDTALNFTGQRTSGGASFLTVYDTTPGDGTATRDLFDATGGLTISADVLFAPGNHAVGAGLVALYGEGQNGISLMAFNGAGGNADFARIGLISQQQGSPTILTSTAALPSTSFLGDTDVGPRPSGCVGPAGLCAPNDVEGDNWYRIVMSLLVTGDTFAIDGYFYNHTDPEDPNSPLGSLITSLSWSGSLSDPGNPLDLINPGEIGLMVYTGESFSDGLGSGGTGADPLTDNIGVSFTNFSFPTREIPEPASLALLGLGLAGLGMTRRRRRGGRC